MTTNNIEERYINSLVSNLPKLDDKASKVVKSFAEFIDELNKVNKLSNGTSIKEKITKLTGELNNSSVFFTQMISDELSKLHSIVNPDITTSEIYNESNFIS